MMSPQSGARGVGRTLARIFAWLVLIVAILGAGLAVFVLNFDWNHAKPWVNEKVSEAIGRPFEIQGDLKVGWRAPVGETGWHAWVPWPRFSATQIAVANPAWARAPHFATLDEIDFEVMVLPLLVHDIVIPAINLVNPSIDAERLADGRNNWTFNPPPSSGPSTWKLNLHNIAFAKGTVALDDQQTKTDVQLTIDLLGRGIPLGEVMQEQEAAARSESAKTIGQAGAQRLAQQAQMQQASEAAAASAAAVSAASAASGASASRAANAGNAGKADNAAASAATASGAAPVSGASAVPAVPANKVAAEPFYAIG
ncbi:MAG: AsmA family protein, partial [Paraburkholderia sp.]